MVVTCILQVKGMLTDFGDDMHCQFLEILRSLMDSYTLSGAQVLMQLFIFQKNMLNEGWHLPVNCWIILLIAVLFSFSTRPFFMFFSWYIDNCSDFFHHLCIVHLLFSLIAVLFIFIIIFQALYLWWFWIWSLQRIWVYLCRCNSLKIDLYFIIFICWNVGKTLSVKLSCKLKILLSTFLFY